MQFGFSQPIQRTEDPRLLTGGGRYIDDVNLPGQLYAYALRSPHAHARITSFDASDAAGMPGVAAILTAKELAEDKIGALPTMFRPPLKPGTEMFAPVNPLIAGEAVKRVGEIVAFVIADSVARAKDAAEAVMVEYDPLPSVTTVADAIAPGAPKVWEEAPDNISFHYGLGDEAAVDAAFAKAHHVTKRTIINNRVAGNPMETRGATATHDVFTGRTTLYLSTQGVHRTRTQIAQAILHIPETDLRVVSNDVGGSFGIKSGNMYPEYALVAWAARRLGRPVKWIAERSEGILTDAHGRDNYSVAELALDEAGHFLALRCTTYASMGSHVGMMGAFVPTQAVGMLAGTYKTPLIYAEVKGVFTNNSLTCPYRGAGRPENNNIIERLVDAAAREMGIDQAEIRRRNVIPKEAMPFKTGLLFTYDSGDFGGNLERCVKLADYDGAAARKADAAARGKLRGIGVANYIERCAGNTDERMEIRFDASGGVTLISGTCTNGQGHETIFPHMAANALGIDVHSIRYVQGDTDQVSWGWGTGSSHCTPVGMPALAQAAEKIIEKGKRIAAHMLEAAPEDMEFEGGNFTVAGTDRAVNIIEVARRAYMPHLLPPDIEPQLAETGVFYMPDHTFPNGCHICELEIEEATGRVEILRYCVVDDVGVVVNPLLMDGQIHGGVVQGVGQALMENVTYDSESGQMLSGSFMDYCMPRADDIVSIETEMNPQPSTANPLGLKGGGEAGTVGALPAVIHAVLDALAPLGIDDIDMPATPEKLWRMIRDARRAQAA